MEALLIERGLEVGGLTKQTRLLVASGPDSALARTALAYNVPVVAEMGLLGLLLGMSDGPGK